MPMTCTCEGVDYTEVVRIFTVQFHPEACARPARTPGFLFDKFIDLIDAHKGSKEAKGA